MPDPLIDRRAFVRTSLGTLGVLAAAPSLVKAEPVVPPEAAPAPTRGPDTVFSGEQLDRIAFPMGGLGAGLRYKPMRYVGLETDLDFMGGHGYAGDDRNETALTFNALFFANPRDRAQIYFLAGFGWDWAHSTNDPSDPSQTTPFDYHYTYFGGQIGLGLELRLTRVLAFNIDLRGFVRTRTDQDAQLHPEFTNTQTGQTTNTSGGALLTGGMTLYF